MIPRDESVLYQERKRIHVALVNTWRVINSKGGTERVFCDLANALSLMGYRVTALCVDPYQGEPGFNLSNAVRFINAGREGKPLLRRGLLKFIRTFNIDRSKYRRNREKNEFAWKAPLLKREIEGGAPVDVYISFQPETTYILSHLVGVVSPIITMFHQEPKTLFVKSAIEMSQQALRASRVNTVLLPSYINQVRNVCPEAHVVAIPNAISYFENPSELKEKKIVCVGRLAIQKRVDLLIKAFALIKDKIPEWSVEYWGEIDVEPKYKKKIFRLISDLDVKDRFHFCGSTDNIEKVLNSASIFAFPSAREGFSLALGEAMSKGLPVVGCVDCSGTNEMVTDGINGFLTDPSPEKFASALEILARNYELRRTLGERARNDIGRCSPDNIWPLWDNLISQIVNK